MYSIYLIITPENGKKYVGMTSKLKQRMATHKHREFRGVDFYYQILEKTHSKQEAFSLEKKWTEQLDTTNPDVGYNKNTGPIPNEGSRKKMSEGQKRRTDRPFLGKKHSDETRKKMSEAKKGKAPSCVGHNSRAVKNMETGEVFEKMTDACERYQLHKAALSRCCLGKQKTSGGFHWQFLET